MNIGFQNVKVTDKTKHLTPAQIIKIEKMFFKVKPTNIPPTKGKILISAPMSNDTFFSRSVVLLTSHDENGSTGYVLNNYVSKPLSHFLNTDIDFEASISLGGPVASNRLYFIHSLGEQIPNSYPLIDDIYWGGDLEVVIELIKIGILQTSQIKFFIGYAGWDKGQLERELEHEYWLVYNANSKTVLKKDTNYWRNTVRSMGKSYSVWLNLPSNPQLN